MSDAEKMVRDFYNNFGWQKTDGASGEDKLFRQFSPPYYPYHERVIARTTECFSGLTGKLLIAGGGDLPESHVTIARQFSEACCLDISHIALDISREKLGDHSEYVLGSLLEIPKPDASFNAAYCAHVIYHIDKDLQHQAIREMIRVVEPGGRIVIIYSNPKSLIRSITEKKSRTPLLWKVQRKESKKPPDDANRPPLYFFAHPLEWWQQFADECQVSFVPWDVMSVSQEKGLLFTNAIAWCAYRFCSWYETRFPRKAVRLWQYSVIVLQKKQP